jgi:hypothetical protein
MGEVSLEKTYEPVSFGKEMRKQFMFAPEWRNFNQGESYDPHSVRLSYVVQVLLGPFPAPSKSNNASIKMLLNYVQISSYVTPILDSLINPAKP